jgi:hypothetical protein
VINGDIDFGNTHKKEMFYLQKILGAEQVSGITFKTAI